MRGFILRDLATGPALTILSEKILRDLATGPISKIPPATCAGKHYHTRIKIFPDLVWPQNTDTAEWKSACICHFIGRRKAGGWGGLGGQNMVTGQSNVVLLGMI